MNQISDFGSALWSFQATTGGVIKVVAALQEDGGDVLNPSDVPQDLALFQKQSWTM